MSRKGSDAQRCTCPSGDGSLRWPCPAHPAEAQVGGEVNPWQFAVDQARIIAHLGIAADGVSKEDAIKQLGELIHYHIAVATDPAVNGGFQLTPVAAPQSAPVGVEAMPGIRRELAGIVRRDDGEPVWIEPNEAAAILRALAQQPAAVDGADKAEDAHAVWANTEHGRMLGLNGPVHGESLRERIRLAFCAGHSAALAAQPGGRKP